MSQHNVWVLNLVLHESGILFSALFITISNILCVSIFASYLDFKNLITDDLYFRGYSYNILCRSFSFSGNHSCLCSISSKKSPTSCLCITKEKTRHFCFAPEMIEYGTKLKHSVDKYNSGHDILMGKMK